MGWGEEEAKRKKEHEERKRREEEAAKVRQEMLPQMLEDTWTALVAQVKAGFRDYAKSGGGGGDFQCIDQNPNNLLVVLPPSHRLEIWRESDRSIIKYNWTDDSGIHHEALKVGPPENIEELSRMICKPFINHLSRRR